MRLISLPYEFDLAISPSVFHTSTREENSGEHQLINYTPHIICIDQSPTMEGRDHISPLLQPNTRSSSPPKTKKALITTIVSLAIAASILFALVKLLPSLQKHIPESAHHAGSTISDKLVPASRFVQAGVSEKSTSNYLSSSPVYPWTNAVLAWQRTSFHFQPPKNWMNDPDGPLFYKGWYHLFYQYNPFSAIWGNITWGHAVSRDLIHWLDLPLAMIPDHWYDINGVWTGSATLLPDGQILMLYTGSTADSVQVQNLAFPANSSDPLLLEWVKSNSNPVLVPPPGIGLKDFRDPTTAWFISYDSTWQIAIGSKDEQHTGIVLVYKTKDFVNYTLVSGVLHAVPGTGMWECVDFFPVATGSNDGLDTSVEAGPGVKHVLKASMDDDKHDYYAIGTYDVNNNTWTPDDPEIDVGIGLRYDYGKFYASKTFYDTARNRRILWGWIGEMDSERTDLLKGWSSVQAIPRTVVYDMKTGTHLLQWPVEEVDNLRLSSIEFSNVPIAPGSVIPLDINKATQLDVLAEFEVDQSAFENTIEADVTYNCSTSRGAAERGLLGPFGILVLADKNLSEQTATYFYIAKNTNGELKTFFCQDELRSSLANDLVKRVYGSIVPVLDGETLSVRIMVDHSIVESFAQGGRTCITSRIYPTKAIYNAARIFLFNNATSATVTAKSIKIWEMNSAFIRPYSDQVQI